jgi:hypothetical protein
MWNLVKFLRQSELIQNLHHRRMNGVPPKLAVKIPVHFEQRNVLTLACKQQRDHRSCGSAAHNATIRLLHVAHFLRCHLRIHLERSRDHGLLHVSVQGEK